MRRLGAAEQHPRPAAAMEGAVVQQALEASVLRAVAAVEERLDAQLQQLERLDDDDLEALRRRRLDDLKR